MRRLVLWVVLACVACATSAAAAGAQVIHTCHSPIDRAELHLIEPGTRCAAPEEELAWNKAGAPGPPGHEGKRGKEGKKGDPGPPGKTKTVLFRDTLEEVVKFAAVALASIVTGLLAAYAAVLALLHLLVRIPLVNKLWPFSRIRRPTFTIEALDDRALQERIGPAMTGLLRSRISVRKDRFGLDYVSGQNAIADALKPFEDLSGAGKVAIELIRYLSAALPRRRFVLCGELQPPGPSGAGISLAFKRADGYDSMTTLWAAPLEIAEAGTAVYQRLAIPAAAWADYQVAKALDGELLSKSPDSWTFFRAGLEAHRLGEERQARSLYEQALGHDGRNSGALANLGLLERRNRKFRRAEELLDDALAELE